MVINWDYVFIYNQLYMIDQLVSNLVYNFLMIISRLCMADAKLVMVHLQLPVIASVYTAHFTLHPAHSPLGTIY